MMLLLLVPPVLLSIGDTQSNSGIQNTNKKCQLKILKISRQADTFLNHSTIIVIQEC